MSQSSRYSPDKLPPIRSRVSSYQLHSISEQRYAEQLVPLDDLASETRYDSMSQKQLVKEHQLLVRRLFKYRELVDIMVARTTRKKKGDSATKKPHNDPSEVVEKEMSNNLKIIANYLNEIRDIEKTRGNRGIDQVLTEQRTLQEKAAQLKKDIFQLKNEDVTSAKSLAISNQDRERQELEGAYKFELNRNAEYRKKHAQLQAQLEELRKKRVSENKGNGPATTNHSLLQKHAQKKQHLEGLRTSIATLQQNLEEFHNVKSRRNQGIVKETQNTQAKINQLQKKIQNYRDNVSRVASP